MGADREAAAGRHSRRKAIEKSTRGQGSKLSIVLRTMTAQSSALQFQNSSRWERGIVSAAPDIKSRREKHCTTSEAHKQG